MTTLTTQALTTDDLIRTALAEDMPNGDITTDNLIPPSHQSTALIETQQPLVISGLDIAERVFKLVDTSLEITLHTENTGCLPKNAPIMTIKGNTQSILKAERLALNILQHLCGIATLTYQYASIISQTKAKITHTRKTLPLLRDWEINAVLDGGGIAHRKSLSEFVLIKDNHLSAGITIQEAVLKTREATPAATLIEVECDTLQQVEEALLAKADRILLDNFSLSNLKTAVQLIGDKAIIEASGGVTLKTVQAIAETGVDIISTSQITLSAPSADIHLELIH